MAVDFARRPSRAGVSPGPRAAAGFTLIELLAASTIFAIVMVAVYMMYETNQRMFWTGDARASAQQNGRIALDDMTTAIRMAGSFYCGRPPAAVISASPSPCPYYISPPLASTDPDVLCAPPTSYEAVQVATPDTLALHGGYADPSSGAPPCNRYVYYTLWNSAGQRTTTLGKWTPAADPWPGQTPSPQPLAENVTALTFTYFDANGQTIPTSVPAPTTPACPSNFPGARPRGNYALDGQGPVTTSTPPSPVGQGSQRDSVRMIRVQITIESNISYDTTSGCYRRDVGGPSQAFTLVSEAYIRSLMP